jgi:hypothetical protein
MPSHEQQIEDHKLPEAVAGGGAGALIGGIAGLAAGLGAMAIPGVGPAIAAGPLAFAIGSAGIGAAAGGIIGALTATETAALPDQPDHRLEETPVAHDVTPAAPSGSLVYLDGLELAPHQDRFEDLEHDYRADFTARDLSGYTYDQFSPAYRYGYTLAGDPRFAREDWLAVEDYAHREWERENPGSWSRVKEAVRYAWQSRRSSRASG